MQRPHGREDLDCPFHNKPMSEVCHKCPLWTQVRGADPQTAQPIQEEWMCGFTAQAFMINDLARELKNNTNKTEKIHTSIDNFHSNMAKLQISNVKALMAESKIDEHAVGHSRHSQSFTGPDRRNIGYQGGPSRDDNGPSPHGGRAETIEGRPDKRGSETS